MIVEEKTISSDRIYTGKIVSLRVDTVELPDHKYQKREIVEHGGAVGIVAVNDKNEILLVKQFRKPIENVLWEIPAGRLEKGENPKDCAMRELKEETGYSAQNIKLIHQFYTSAGFSNEKLYIYLATNLSKGDMKLDEGEYLDVHTVTLDEALNMVLSNEIKDAKTSIGVLMCRELL